MGTADTVWCDICNAEIEVRGMEWVKGNKIAEDQLDELIRPEIMKLKKLNTIEIQYQILSFPAPNKCKYLRII